MEINKKSILGIAFLNTYLPLYEVGMYDVQVLGTYYLLGPANYIRANGNIYIHNRYHLIYNEMRENISFIESSGTSSLRITVMLGCRQQRVEFGVYSRRARHAAKFYSFLEMQFVLFSAYIHRKLCEVNKRQGIYVLHMAPSTRSRYYKKVLTHTKSVQETHI